MSSRRRSRRFTGRHADNCLGKVEPNRALISAGFPVLRGRMLVHACRSPEERLTAAPATARTFSSAAQDTGNALAKFIKILTGKGYPILRPETISELADMVRIPVFRG